MKKLLTVMAMLLTFGLVANSAVAAQGTEVSPAGAAQGFEDMEGFESAYQRGFSPEVDFSNSEGINLADMMKGINIMAITFDSDDNAEKAFDDTLESMDEAMNGEGMEGMELEMEETDDFGDQGIRVSTSMEMDAETTLYIEILAVRDGDTIWMITAIDAEETVRDTNDAVMEYILDQDIETEEVTLIEEGGSTGGVFDKMPNTGDEVVGDLMNDSDMDLTAPVETPAN